MSFALIASLTSMVRHCGSGLETKRKHNMKDCWKITGFLHMYHLAKQVFEENITVGKYVLFAIVRFALTRHVVEAGTSSSSLPLLSLVQ